MIIHLNLGAGSKALTDLLSIDCIQNAEDLTGASSHTDATTLAAAMSLTVAHSKKKEEILNQIGDSTLSMDMPDYLKVVEAAGFIKVYEEEFIPSKSDTLDEGAAIPEKFYLYHHPTRNVLLKTDTWSYRAEDGTIRVCRNSATAYFEVTPTEKGFNWPFSCSGQWFSPSQPRGWEPGLENIPDDLILLGRFDAREALLHHMKLLETGFTPVNPWIHGRSPKFLWLLNYVESKIPKVDYRAISLQKLLQTPPEVQAALNVAFLTSSKADD